MSQRFSCATLGVRELPISLFASEVAYLVRVDCLYLIKLMVVGFWWRCNSIVGSSISFLTDLILFRYQTAIITQRTQLTLIINILRNSKETTF